MYSCPVSPTIRRTREQPWECSPHAQGYLQVLFRRRPLARGG